MKRGINIWAIIFISLLAVSASANSIWDWCESRYGASLVHECVESQILASEVYEQQRTQIQGKIASDRMEACQRWAPDWLRVTRCGAKVVREYR